MASKKAPRARASTRRLNAALKGLVEALSDNIAARIERQLPARERIGELEREVRELSKRLDRRTGGAGRGRVGRPPSNRRCDVAGCGRPHVAHGYCSKHYQAWRRSEASGRPAPKKAGRGSRGRN